MQKGQTGKMARKRRKKKRGNRQWLKELGVVPLEDILPRRTRILGGVGPTPISQGVLLALTRGLGIDHLGEPMSTVTTQISQMTRLIFEVPDNYIALCSYGAATGAMEMALNAAVWPGMQVLSCINGHFSRRMAEIAQRLGAVVKMVEVPLGQPITLEIVRKELEGNQPYSVLTIGHGETSTGVLSAETTAICKLAKEKELITIVDGVCTIPCLPLSVAKSGVDICFGGAQKGFASVPGANPIVFSPEAWDRALRLPRPTPSYLLDPIAAYDFWMRKQYHVTAPVQVIFALHTAMWEILSEGLSSFQRRHAVASRALQEGLEAAGFELYTPAEYRLPTAIAVRFGTPDGNGDSTRSQFRNALKDQAGVVIAGAFGGLPIVRVGCMGWQATEKHIRTLLWAMANRAKVFGIDTHRYHASVAVRRVFHDAGYANPFKRGVPPEGIVRIAL
ncbi:MAG: aminotransferase class V-fold PLP-dependent enzyme [Parcubacteria group bacterium]